MAAPSPGSRASSARARALAIVLSMVVHVGVISGLLWQMRGRPAEEGPGAMQVELFRPRSEQRRANQSPPAKPRKAPTESQASQARAITAIRAPASPLIAPPPVAAPPPPEGVTQALRRGFGCAHADFYGLTPAEREDCERRAVSLGRTGPDGPVYGLSAEKQASFEAERKRSDLLQQPFLAERPQKGCKPTVTEHEGGVVGRAPPNWTASIACGIPF